MFGIGVAIAPFALQRDVNSDVLGPTTEGWKVICMDGMLVFGRNVQEYLQRLQRALQLPLPQLWSEKAQEQ